jgi:hypothetical protein
MFRGVAFSPSNSQQVIAQPAYFAIEKIMKSAFENDSQKRLAASF